MKKENIKTYSIIAICTLLVGCVIFNVTAFGSDSYDENSVCLNNYLKLQVDKIELQNKLDEDSTYPEYYIREKSLELGDISLNESMKKTKDSIVETEALCWYAKVNGIIVNDYDVDKLMDEIIKEGKDAENYKEIQEACDNAGVAFETTVYKNRIFYEKQLYADKVYESEYSKMYPQKKISADNLENVDEEWAKSWEQIVQDIVDMYKNTDEYRSLSKALNKDEVILKRKLTDVQKINQIDIPVDGFIK